MVDQDLIALYVARSETAISETQKQYGSYCHAIAYGILRNQEDSEECVNDTYWKAWETIPPTYPRHMRAFLGKITRNLALHLWERLHTAKRGGSEIPYVLEELADCIPSEEDVEQQTETAEVRACFNTFLETLPAETRKVFVRRYWYMDTIPEIANAYGMGQSKVKMLLLRTRKLCREYLEQEGITL